LPSSLTPPPPPTIYPLSLHDALPIYGGRQQLGGNQPVGHRGDHLTHDQRVEKRPPLPGRHLEERLVGQKEGDDENQHQAARQVLDRKSTRLNSSHLGISYAVFCLKKK